MSDIKKEFELSRYRTICKNVPRRKLSKKQKQLVRRCADGETDFNDSEMEVLAEVTRRYGKAIETVKADEILKGNKKVIETIQTEHELLDLLEKEKTNQTLTVDLPFKDGEKRVTFDVLPITDSRAITSIEKHTKIYSNLDTNELDIFNRGRFNIKDLTPVELEVYEDVMEKLKKEYVEHSSSIINDFLTHQLKIKGSDVSLKIRRRIWEKMDYNVKMAIFMKVEALLGLNDFDSEKLFPVIE